MIATNLKNIERYKGLSDNLDMAIAWLQEGLWSSLPEDAHRPCIAIEDVPIAVYKIVVKVAI